MPEIGMQATPEYDIPPMILLSRSGVLSQLKKYVIQSKLSKELLQSQIHPKNRNSGLHYCALGGPYLECMEYLLEELEFDPNAQNVIGETALHCMVNFGKDEEKIVAGIELMKRYGGKVDLVNNFGKSCIDMAKSEKIRQALEK